MIVFHSLHNKTAYYRYILQYKEGAVPANTANNTEWAYKNFES